MLVCAFDLVIDRVLADVARVWLRVVVKIQRTPTSETAPPRCWGTRNFSTCVHTLDQKRGCYPVPVGDVQRAPVGALVVSLFLSPALAASGWRGGSLLRGA